MQGAAESEKISLMVCNVEITIASSKDIFSRDIVMSSKFFMLFFVVSLQEYTAENP